VGESGHFVRTISLRCYKILMQFFMLLYSTRNAVVHPCKTFSIFLLRLVGEGTNFENAFFLKIWCAIFEVFRLAGAIVKLTKFGVATLIFGHIGPPPISWKATQYSNLLRQQQFTANKCPPVMHWLLANAYVFLVWNSLTCICWSDLQKH